VPHDVNPGADIQPIVDKLARCGTAPDLTVVILVNRRGRFDPAALRIPKDIRIGGLWAIMALTPDQFGEWRLWGDLLSASNSSGHIFRYPE
jgi:hypothetical protein